MFHVRLASGEEAVFRSVDELALGIQSGTVTSSAELFHRESNRWLPIGSLPEYEAAVERAAGQVATAEPEIVPVEAGAGAVPQIYQMFSRSARELAERRRPRWHARVAAATAGVAVLAAVAITLRPGPQGPEEAVLPRPIIRAAPQPRAPARPGGITEDERRALQAPYNMATRFARAREAAATTLADSAAKLGLAGVLRRSRLESSDSLRQTLTGLAALKTLIAKYRSDLDGLRVAYRDTAGALIRAGRWSRAEAQEWRARVLWPEPALAAARADTLLLTLARLHSLLLSQPGRANFGAGGFVAETDSAGVAYDRLRRDLQRLRSLSLERQNRAGLPLLTIVSLLGTDTLPSRRGA